MIQRVRAIWNGMMGILVDKKWGNFIFLKKECPVLNEKCMYWSVLRIKRLNIVVILCAKE